MSASAAPTSCLCSNAVITALLQIDEVRFPTGMWTLSRIHPGVLTSYPQSVDAYTKLSAACLGPATCRGSLKVTALRGIAEALGP
jgi:hypothetical protein